MNKAEARGILVRELLHFRAMSYSDLQKLMGSPQVVERSGASGVSYTIEIEVFWDSVVCKNLDRVIACKSGEVFLYDQ